ncbi:hypothetical protein [Agromyces sp. Leaf222]|uniref:hypothetical protein n=1 Tax=Agromyces sp. Leaf222 TaxID=1735688 RepID=UPI0007011AE3|nr:hypothetical protein [Agromyces sp. Leaf222]KQM83040.1 hypothetical protein ASE68_07100 [Agromyces sp. Leaf222]
MKTIELRQARHLEVGDTLVNVAGHVYEVTKVTRIGRGIRVQYLTAEGRPGRFTAAPEALSRVYSGSSRQAPISA